MSSISRLINSQSGLGRLFQNGPLIRVTLTLRLLDSFLALQHSLEEISIELAICLEASEYPLKLSTEILIYVELIQVLKCLGFVL